MTVPTILRLKIDRFRGLKAIDWSLSGGLNLMALVAEEGSEFAG